MKKTNSFKRAIAVFISVLMVVSSLPFTAITTSAVDNSGLNSAITAYENKMNGTVYTNMKSAYLAYVEAKKAQEVLKYGDTQTYSNIANVTSNLLSATNAMQAWITPYGNEKVRMYNDATDITHNEAYGDVNHTSILYAKNITDGDGWQYANGGNNNRFAFNSNPVIVFLYDGTTIKYPVMSGFNGNGGCGSDRLFMRSFYPIVSGKITGSSKDNRSPDDNPYFQLTGPWIGHSDGDDSGKTGNGGWKWADAKGKTDGVAGYNKQTSGQTTDISDGLTNTNKMYCYANTLKFVGTDSFENGYLYTNIGWYGFGDANSNYKGSYAFQNGSKCYVIDYRSVLSAIDGSKKTYLSQITTKYTQNQNNGMSNILEKYDALTSINPTTTNYVNETETTVKNMASDLQSKANALNEAGTPKEDVTYTITVKNADDSNLAEYQMSTACNAYTVQCALNTLTPATSSKDDEYHNVYSWPTAEKVTDNKEYKATATQEKHSIVNNGDPSLATCIADGSQAIKCSNCDYTSETLLKKLEHSYTGASVHTDADGDNNGYTQKYCVNGCNELGGRVYDKNTDWSAYDAAVVEANANIGNTVKYTADSISDYSDEVAKYKAGVTSGDEKKSQAFIDRMTDGITQAKPILKLNTYDVTFNVQYNTNTIYNEKDTVAYGTVKQFNYTPDDGKYIDKWTAEDVVKTSTIATASEIASHTIYSDTIVTVYICDTDKGSDDTCSVTLLDKNNKVIGFANVAKDSTITKNGNTLVLANNVVLVAPKYPYYQITDFIDVSNNENVDGITVTGDMVIKAKYSVSPTITITSSQAVTINGVDTSSYNAKWDERVTVTAQNATAWYAGGKLLAYGSTYTFQASADLDLSYAKEEVSKTDASSRIDYTSYDSDLKAFRIVVSNCVPDNATIVKQGVKILTSSKTGVTVASSKVIAGTKDYVATKTTGTGKQFMYTIGVADSINTMAVVSYVAYTVPGDSEVHYAYSSTGDATATMISK